MRDFTESSQLHEWMFSSVEELEKCRAKANQQAREYLAKPPDVQEASKASLAFSAPVYTAAKGYSKRQKKAPDTEDPTTAGPWKNAKEHPFITPNEEALLVAFYTSKVPMLIGPLAQVPRLRRESKVTATASMLLKRFFLSNSVMLHDPKAVMVAACFCATKIEDATADVRYLEDGTNLMNAPVSQAEILPAELALLEGISFQLLCFHPFKPVVALTEDLRSFLKSEKGLPLVDNRHIAGEDLKPMYDAARAALDDIIVSDLPFLYTPGQLGLAAMIVANEDLNAKRKEKQRDGSNEEDDDDDDGVGLPNLDLLAYIRLRFSDERGHELEAAMKELVPMIRELKEGKHGCANQNVDMTELKNVHKRLKKCRGWGKKDNDKKDKKSKKRSKEDGGDDEPKKKKAKS